MKKAKASTKWAGMPKQLEKAGLGFLLFYDCRTAETYRA